MRAKHLSSGLNLVVKDLVTDIGFRANLVLPCGGITLLLGANGAGKSTLLKTILGLRTKISGTVAVVPATQSALANTIDFQTVDEENNNEQAEIFKVLEVPNNEIISLTSPKIGARYLSYVPQNFMVSSNLTVQETVKLGGKSSFWGFSAESSELLAEVLKITRIEALKDRSVATLSGGELALVNLARALMQDTCFLLIDEGDASLDLGRRTEFYHILSKWALTKNRGILLVTHTPEMALRSCKPQQILLTMPNKTLMSVKPQALTSELLSKSYGASLTYAGALGGHTIS